MKYNYTVVFLLVFSLAKIFCLANHDASKPVLLIVGTRPEGIKMLPIYHALKKYNIPTIVCSTGQHGAMLDEVFNLFDAVPDKALNIMIPGQDLFHITTAVLSHMKDFLQEINPSLVLVQGDTTTAVAAALASFYLKIPVGHIEAGLRSGNIMAPYPEEMNRRIISIIATYHFAPTQLSVENLKKENITQQIFCVGNTVVDALHAIREKIVAQRIMPSHSLQNLIHSCKEKKQKIMLLTAHRRESFSEGLKNIFTAIKITLEKNPDLFIIYPMHPNPAIKRIYEEAQLRSLSNISVTSPLAYSDLVYLLDNVDFVATDSGGIQEEAVSLGKPVLILRNETDRPEGIGCGIAQLTGTNTQAVVQGISHIIQTPVMQFEKNNVYGDGTASEQIAHIIKNILIS